MSRELVKNEEQKKPTKTKDQLKSREKTPHPNKLKKFFNFFNKAGEQLVDENPKKAAGAAHNASVEVKKDSTDGPTA